MNISAEFQSILSIRELDGIWKTKVIVEISWFDKRLKMQNLKKNSNLNILSEKEIKSIWIPEIIFTNTEEENRIIFDEKALVSIERGNVPGEPVSLDYLTPALIFAGEDNRISYRRTYDSELYCNFDLTNYPLDKQSCGLSFKVPSSSSDFVDLHPLSVEYNGPRLLSQFNVIGYSFFKQPSGVIGFEVSVKRMFFYHLISVYIPSSCLLFIVLITCYIDVDHFEGKIMVHLTANVIMYTLFQAVSINLPQVLACYKYYHNQVTWNGISDCLHQVFGHLAVLWPLLAVCCFYIGGDRGVF